MTNQESRKGVLSRRTYLYPYAGPGGKNYLRQLGTKDDIAKTGTILREGMRLSFWNDDSNDEGQPDPLYFDGIVHFDSEAGEWYVVIDDESYHHESDLKSAKGAPPAPPAHQL
jgi:hypothetical protein